MREPVEIFEATKDRIRSSLLDLGKVEQNGKSLTIKDVTFGDLFAEANPSDYAKIKETKLNNKICQI